MAICVLDKGAQTSSWRWGMGGEHCTVQMRMTVAWIQVVGVEPEKRAWTAEILGGQKIPLGRTEKGLGADLAYVTKWTEWLPEWEENELHF